MGFYTVNQEGFPPRSQLIHTTYNLLFPTCLSHPSKCAPSLFNNPLASPLPFQGFNNRPNKNSQRTIAVVGIPLGEITSPTTSLTWRELLIGMTTCFFYSNKISHLERVSHRLDNLLLQYTVLITCLFTPAPR
jgi:hypothetical protein